MLPINRSTILLYPFSPDQNLHSATKTLPPAAGWSLKGLSIGSDKWRRPETSVDSKICGCTRNFLHGVEEVARSNRVAPTRFFTPASCFEKVHYAFVLAQTVLDISWCSFGSASRGSGRSHVRIVSPRPGFALKTYTHPLSNFRLLDRSLKGLSIDLRDQLRDLPRKRGNSGSN